jgi:hypothetical protein
MRKLSKIKESKNEDKSFDLGTDEEKKSNRGSNRSKSSDDSLNKRDHLEIESPAKHKDLNIKFSSASEDTDVFNKSPKNNSDHKHIEVESTDSVGRLSGGNSKRSKHKLNQSVMLDNNSSLLNKSYNMNISENNKMNHSFVSHSNS